MVKSIPWKAAIQMDKKYLKNTIHWDETSCNPSKITLRFGGTYRRHLQGRKTSRERYQLGMCFPAGILLGLVFDSCR
jgi:hypothetical protein